MYVPDNHYSLGVKISVEKLFSLVDQKEIFKYSLGFYPELGKLYTSPYREDNNPDCFFDYDPKGVLKFNDYGDSRVIKGIRVHNSNSIDSYILLNNCRFDYALSHLYSELVLKKNRKSKGFKCKKAPKKKVSNLIVPYKRPFDLRDKAFWTSYYITKKQLISDSVFPIKSFRFINRNNKRNSFASIVKDIAYCYSEFDFNSKIYFPERKRSRFISTCTEKDIGGLLKLQEVGEELIITKSYKDYRVLKNQDLNVIWFQNEGCLPKVHIKKLVKRFSKIVILFDNDRAGKEASDKIFKFLEETKKGVTRKVFVPNFNRKVKDPSDFIKYSISDFNVFINTNFDVKTHRLHR